MAENIERRIDYSVLKPSKLQSQYLENTPLAISVNGFPVKRFSPTVARVHTSEVEIKRTMLNDDPHIITEDIA